MLFCCALCNVNFALFSPVSLNFVFLVLILACRKYQDIAFVHICAAGENIYISYIDTSTSDLFPFALL